MRHRKVERDKTHMESVERWARYVKDNPDKWKIRLKEFLDAQILMSRRFYKQLAETPGGKDKIERLRNERKQRS